MKLALILILALAILWSATIYTVKKNTYNDNKGVVQLMSVVTAMVLIFAAFYFFT